MSRHRSRPAPAACLLTLVTLLTACGGGGGGDGDRLAAVDPVPPGSSGGIGGSGISTSGTITGSGSIFVNGQRFAIDQATITVDGEPASEAALTLGMIVSVSGSIGDDDGDGSADRVTARTALRGPVASLERGSNDRSLQLRVFGTAVIVERDGTVFEGTDFAALTAGMQVAIDGLPGADGRLRGTRVSAVTDSDTAILTGTATLVDGATFLLGEQPVNAAGAMFEGLPEGLADGRRVQVRGSLSDGVLRAARVSAIGTPADDLSEGAALRLEGRVAGLGDGTFLLNGIPVLPGDAERLPPELLIEDGAVVEAAGRWNGEALAAQTLTARRGTLRLAGAVNAIDSDAGTLALQLPNAVVTLSTDRRTLIEDRQNDLPFPTLADLRSGDQVAVEALRSNGSLLATRIDRGAETPARVLQAPVEAFTAPATITLLGITVAVDGARFQSAVATDIDAAAFFDNLSVGALVRTVDDDGDGRAERVAFQFPLALDGELAFRDDQALPATGDRALPAAVASAVAAEAPGRATAGAWLGEEGYEVVLVDGTRLFFELDGRFLNGTGPSAPAAAKNPGKDGDIPGNPGDNPGSGGEVPGNGGGTPGGPGENPGQGPGSGDGEAPPGG
ncbi:DUF5666 domain-containing protein [Pseudohaliea rubra]|uniref:DUF5666 domain-containing protein n=1 Tax=Pseudohaliea rubra DSM 19751 TaxID=1265313 RepID=A0A095XST1_9GAMM|nr:DUF5666 domain-containing protein [Pseudohaliea rubra]KGE02726.1 hypothetical protein HRUBRA_02704 [Pseudohaliea rubra DSM 19751]